MTIEQMHEKDAVDVLNDAQTLYQEAWTPRSSSGSKAAAAVGRATRRRSGSPDEDTAGRGSGGAAGPLEAPRPHTDVADGGIRAPVLLGPGARRHGLGARAGLVHSSGYALFFFGDRSQGGGR